MKVNKKWMGVLLMLLFLNASVAFGADVSAEVDLNSAYVWRGLTFNDGLVAQPSLDVTSGGLDLNVWANYDLDSYDGTVDKYEFSEVDLTMSYSHSLGPVDVTGGIIEYLFPATKTSDAQQTQEVFLGISKELFTGFTAGATGYYDFDQVDDYYLNPYIDYSLDLGKGFSMDFGASCGVAGKKFSEIDSGGTQGGFHEYTLTIGSGYTVGAYTFSANIGYTDSLKKAVLPNTDVHLFGGAGVSVAF